MSSRGSIFTVNNVALQRPIKYNWNTSLSSGTIGPTFTLGINEDSVVVNGVEVKGGGLLNHCAFEYVFQQPQVPADHPEVLITFPGTTSSSAYKPLFSIYRTTPSQYDTANGEDIYLQRTAANSYLITRVTRNVGVGVQDSIYILITVSANTD
jgi:hypothetical protein